VVDDHDWLGTHDQNLTPTLLRGWAASEWRIGGAITWRRIGAEVGWGRNCLRRSSCVSRRLDLQSGEVGDSPEYPFIATGLLAAFVRGFYATDPVDDPDQLIADATT
jgi:hypothetical protein